MVERNDLRKLLRSVEFVRDGKTAALVTPTGVVLAWLSDDVDDDVGETIAVACRKWAVYRDFYEAWSELPGVTQAEDPRVDRFKEALKEVEARREPSAVEPPKESGA